MKEQVCAVIVTFNKLHLLKECLEAVKSQTVPVGTIYVINNNSNDGTKEYLESQNGITSLTTSENIGGAGGFKLGIKEFYKKTDNEFCWIMDDDTIPDRDCLKNLLEAGASIDNRFGFLSSYVYWTDHNPCLMNIPNISTDWYKGIPDNLIKVKQASFVSLFVKRESIEKVGLPIGEFFIWGDDSEYTERLSNIESSYMATKSKSLHKMGENTSVDIISDNTKRVPRYFYSFRNRFFVAKCRGIKAVVRELCRNIYLVFKILIKSSDGKYLRIKQIVCGQFAGIVFNPKIEGVGLNNEY